MLRRVAKIGLLLGYLSTASVQLCALRLDICDGGSLRLPRLIDLGFCLSQARFQLLSVKPRHHLAWRNRVAFVD